MALVLADSVKLPTDAATQTLLVIGKRGSGKTSTAVRFVEQLIAARVSCVVLDPADVWWGLKAPGPTGRPGLNVYVFGGRKADVPLEAGGGELVADIVVDHLVPRRLSAVLSVRHLSGLERSHFVTDFAKHLVDRMGEQDNERVHVVLEEAHELAPQSVIKGERQEHMLGAIKRLWKLGRSSGIGGTAITQRPAALHKDITTQSEVLVVHKIIGPQDVEAVRKWIQYHGQAESILPELSKLHTGEAFVWAPDYPSDKPLGLVRAQILPRETYDSSATPTGATRTVGPVLAPVDLDVIRDNMAAAIERQKADDPRLLRQEIAEFREAMRLMVHDRERDLAAAREEGLAQGRTEAPEPEPIDLGPLARTFTTLQDDVESMGVHIADALAALNAAGYDTVNQRMRVVESKSVERRLNAQLRPVAREAAIVQHRRIVEGGAPAHAIVSDSTARALRDHPSKIVPARQRILDSLAWLATFGNDSPDRTRLAFLAEAQPTSSTYENNLGALRTAGLIDYPGPRLVRLTPAGRKHAQAGGPRTTEELQTFIYSRLTPARQRILKALIKIYPGSCSRAQLAQAVDASAGSSTFENNLGALRSFGVIDYPSQGQVVALAVLFL